MNNILQMVMSSKNPQQMAMQLLQQNAGNNPAIRNVLNMANTNNTQGIEQIARAMCRERGINPDEMMNNILQMKRH